MADFGPSITEAPQTRNYVTPQAGVADSNAGLKGAVNLFEQVSGLRDQQKEKAGEAAVTRFTNTQLGIIQAVDQGKMSSQYARTLMRKNLMEGVTNNPGLRKDLIAANSSIIGQGGMGSIITEGTQSEMRRSALRDDLVQQGMVSPDASEEEFARAEQDFMSAAAAKETFDRQMDAISMERAKTNLTTSQIELLDKRQQQAAESFLVDSAPAHMDQFKETANKIIGGIGTDWDEATAVSMIEERFNNFEEEMAVPLSQTDSATGDALMKNYRDWKEVALKRARGEFTQQQYDREQERIISKNQLSALRNPTISKMVSMSELLGASAPALIGQQTAVIEATANYFNGNMEDSEVPSNLYTDDPQKRDALKGYLDMISTTDANLTDEQLAEQSQHIARIFEGVEDYESVIQKSPEKGIGLVTDWMSTQNFYRLRTQNPEAFANTDTAMRILQTNYGDEVWGMISREFRNNDVYVAPEGSNGIVRPSDLMSEDTQGEMVPTTELVGTRRTSGGMEFIALDENSNESTGMARRLNRDLAPVINKNIKAFAHLEGSNDYGGYWDKISEQYLTGGMESPEAVDGDDDLELSMFTRGIENAEAIDYSDIDNSLLGTLQGRSFTETGTMSGDPEGMIIHHTAGRGDVNTVARVLQERNASVQYVVDREGKVHQLMDDRTVAWHAGKNNTSGFDNSNTIGVEVIGRDDSDILPVQIEATKRLIQRLSQNYGFDPKTRVFGHGEVATHKRPNEGMSTVSQIRGN